ncbi:MAG: CmcJ/NvfI family oxidoreductase [Pseudomonadota bacterium]|nr:CmcJ/NvfI family oxidoreductase [Pseudomonadota bacterium]
MSQATEAVKSVNDLEATVMYSVDTGVKPVNETFEHGNLIRRSTGGKREGKTVSIADGRVVRDELDLEVHGFEFVDHVTKMTDFFDEEELKQVYYSEVEALIKKVSGAQRVQIFDHTLRSGNEKERQKRLIREPVLSAHNDYTEWSGPQRVRDLLPDEADKLLKGRFAVIQVWRAINQPVLKNPLAIADWRTLAMDDLIVSERRYPDRRGETYQVKYNAAHRWYYFPKMTRDEALVFKVYDSDKGGRARFTAHTSFDDPTSPSDAYARQSIEMHTLAFFK